MTTLEPTCLLTTKEAAEWMRRSEATIRWWVHKGWLSVYTTLDGVRMFSDAALIDADNHARRVSVPSGRLSA